MNYNDFFVTIPVLETDRLFLRGFCRDDMKAYLEIIHSPFVQKYLGGVNLFSEEPHLSNWLNNINSRLLKSKTVFTWCVELKSEKK